jgi:tRNA(Ile)-lysidine synthetase-like protein
MKSSRERLDFFGPDIKVSPGAWEPRRLAVPGTVKIAQRGMSITVSTVRPSDDARIRDPSNRTFHLCFGARVPELTVRPLASSDRMVPLGMDRPVRVREYLKNRRVPAFLRDGTPVVADEEGEIVCVPGVAIAQPYRVDEKSVAMVRLTVRDI